MTLSSVHEGGAQPHRVEIFGGFKLDQDVYVTAPNTGIACGVICQIWRFEQDGQVTVTVPGRADLVTVAMSYIVRVGEPIACCKRRRHGD